MAFLLIPVILLAVIWLSYICRRLSELNENVNTAMNQIGLQLSSRFRALEALLELARTHGLSAQLVLLPPSINALSTPAQVLEQEQHLAQAMSYITIAAENHPSLKADPAYQRCMEAANCYSRMVYTSSLIYNDSVTRLNCALEQSALACWPVCWALPRGNTCSLHRMHRWPVLSSPRSLFGGNPHKTSSSS